MRNTCRLSSSVSWHPQRPAKVTCNFNISLVTTRILLLTERCHVRIYWAAFSALYLRVPRCVTCRGEGLAELLQGEQWVSGHSREVGCSPAPAAWAAWLSTGWRYHLHILVCHEVWLPSARHKTGANICFQEWHHACSPHTLSVLHRAAQNLTKF